MNASVSGLAANASRLASISDNIANSSTYGYKRAVTDFATMVIEGGRGTYTAGGVRTNVSRLIDERGALVATSNPTDLAVRGRGMLPVTTAASVAIGNGENPLLLTTTGSFRQDAQGYLVSPGGMVLLGVPASPDGTIPDFPRDSVGGLVPVQINRNEFASEPTTRISLAVNLPATATREGAAGADESLSVDYFDNLGASANLTFGFTPIVPLTGASNSWTLQIWDSETDLDADGVADLVGEYTLTFDETRGGAGALTNVVNTASGVGGPYDAQTGSLNVAVNGGPIEILIGQPGTSGGLTQLSDAFAPIAIAKNGAAVGNLTSVEVDRNGFVRASFDTGVSRVLYQVPLVDVANLNGLEAFDQQSFRVTPTSGNFFLWDAGDGPTGEVVNFAREESATDVAGELTELIQTQRAYSSNAKVIQTVDEMLQETTNIKR